LLASIHSRKITALTTSSVTKPVDDKVRRLASLEAYYPEKFLRPDFSKYSFYRPEAASAEQEQELKPVAPPEPLPFDVPEPISAFLKVLPPSTAYMGPVLPIEDIMALLLQSPLPLPLQMNPMPVQQQPLQMVNPMVKPPPPPAPMRRPGIDPRKRKGANLDDHSSKRQS
jgi:hypothetical protein